MTRSQLPAVAAKGDRGATLRALRDMLASSIAECNSARDKAALGRLLVDVLAQIDQIGGGRQTEEDRTFDELSRRRTGRGANPARRTHPAGSQPG